MSKMKIHLEEKVRVHLVLDLLLLAPDFFLQQVQTLHHGRHELEVAWWGT